MLYVQCLLTALMIETSTAATYGSLPGISGSSNTSLGLGYRIQTGQLPWQHLFQSPASSMQSIEGLAHRQSETPQAPISQPQEAAMESSVAAALMAMATTAVAAAMGMARMATMGIQGPTPALLLGGGSSQLVEQHTGDLATTPAAAAERSRFNSHAKVQGELQEGWCSGSNLLPLPLQCTDRTL